MIDVKELKRRVNIKEALEYYGISFNSRGLALCPFHREKTPSLHTHGDIYTCFGCGAQGDIVNFVQTMFKLSFKDSLEKIDADFGLGLGDSLYILSKEEKDLNTAIAKAEKRMFEKEKRIYDSYCEEIIALEKALAVIDPNSEAAKMLRDRINEIEADMEDQSGLALQLRYEKEVAYE